MTPEPHQVKTAKEVAAVLKENGLAYLEGEERVGKTLSLILVCDWSPYKNILVLTTKKALDGWEDTLARYKHKKLYTVTNYHQAKNLSDEYDAVILDECHNYLSAYPKVSNIWRSVKSLCFNKPILYSSATPNAQGHQQLFHQFALSSYSPWRKYVNFYKWFKDYGHPYTVEIRGIDTNQYDRCKTEKIIDEIDHLFVRKTRKEAGHTFEPEDIVHYVEADEDTKYVYNQIIEDELYELSVGMLVCDTESKMRYALHMLEGGTMKIFEDYFTLANTEKIDFIKREFGDSEDVVIMYNYKQEGIKLREHFKKALILQGSTYAEGVDLHTYEHLIIYSQDFRTSKHSQRRARQANKNRKTPIKVHFLLFKNGISHQVYKTVSLNKKNFVNSSFERAEL